MNRKLIEFEFYNLFFHDGDDKTYVLTIALKIGLINIIFIFIYNPDRRHSSD